MPHPSSARVREFLARFSALVERANEAAILSEGTAILGDLVSHDDWLPDDFARPDPDRYQQYLLYADPQERFSMVSFVWDVGQSTPVHDHRTWGLVGMLRGSETSQSFAIDAGRLLPLEAVTLRPGDVIGFSPATGDIHQVLNANPDGPSISIHLYGLNIGRVSRSTYAIDGTEKAFISGFGNRTLPNFWNN